MGQDLRKVPGSSQIYVPVPLTDADVHAVTAEQFSHVAQGMRYMRIQFASADSKACGAGRYRNQRSAATSIHRMTTMVASRRTDGQNGGIALTGGRQAAGECASPSQTSSYQCTCTLGGVRYPGRRCFMTSFSSLCRRAHTTGACFAEPGDAITPVVVLAIMCWLGDCGVMLPICDLKIENCE